eukprot:9471626-Pyramimonas_sp.AAC.1
MSQRPPRSPKRGPREGTRTEIPSLSTLEKLEDAPEVPKQPQEAFGTPREIYNRQKNCFLEAPKRRPTGPGRPPHEIPTNIHEASAT